MRYRADDPKFDNYKVELDGVIQPDAVEADDVEGWVKTEKTKTVWMKSWVEKKTLYGRVFIIRFESADSKSKKSSDELEPF